MKRTSLKNLVVALLALAALASSSRSASAQNCFFAMPNFNYGNIDLNLGTAFDLTGNLRFLCFGTGGAQVKICPNIASGTGGAAASGDPRYLLSGGTQLNYNIYQDAAFSTVWGSTFGAFSPPEPVVSLGGFGIAFSTFPVRVRIHAGQTSLPAGLYSSSFAGAQTLFSYAYFTGQSCTAIGGANATQVPFNIQANHIGACTVSANNLNFGTLSLLSSNADASTSVSVTCTLGLSYQVGLNGGLTGATNPTLRQMASGPNQITYGLYQNAGRTTPWGDTLGTNTIPGTGTGAAQSLTVYGRIPIQTTPPPGAYSDTIIVTVTY